MQTRSDVIVVGLGAVGSAALYQLARRGAKALGLDRFHPPHELGSSHGETRITRLAVAEGDEYVQFVRRSHEIWRELESATGESLMQQVGGLIFGSASGRTVTHGSLDFLAATIAEARRQGIRHETLAATELAARFPQFKWRGDEQGYLEHEAGFVRPEACIRTQLDMARRAGAEIRAGTRVLKWRASGAGVSVETDRERYETAHLILCAGAWLPQMVAPLAAQAQVFRQVLFWFEPEGPAEMFAPERMPVFIRVPDADAEMFYGFPAINGTGGGLKIASEQFDRTSAPDEIEMEVHESEMLAMHAAAAKGLRISRRCIRAAVCKYTMLPGFRFAIDRHAETDRVWYASACSGHGFKHSAAVGEALAEVTLESETRYDLSRFRSAGTCGAL